MYFYTLSGVDGNRTYKTPSGLIRDIIRIGESPHHSLHGWKWITITGTGDRLYMIFTRRLYKAIERRPVNWNLWLQRGNESMLHSMIMSFT